MSQQHAIGSMEWFKQTGGNLSIKSRLSLLSSVLAPSMSDIAKSVFRYGRRLNVSLEGIPLPDSQAVKIALEEIESSASNSILQHSFRCYFWGAGLSQIENLKFDPEFLLVSSLLHDVSVSEKHRDHSCSCFAANSARLAVETMKHSDWNQEKLNSLAESICLHMNGFVDQSHGNEAHLLQQAAAFDIAGSRYYDLSKAYRDAVLRKHPRANINQDFASFIREETKLHPSSRAALMQNIGLPLMIKLNPFTD